MRNSENSQAGNVTDLDVARERRHYIDLANADWDWRQVKASFALEGMIQDDRDAERAGRYLAGVMTFEQVKEDILREFGLTDSRQTLHTGCSRFGNAEIIAADL